MVVLILVVAVLVIVVVRLQHALEAVREDLADARRRARTDAWPAERLDALQRRVSELEARARVPSETAVPPPPPVEVTLPAVALVLDAPCAVEPSPETRAVEAPAMPGTPARELPTTSDWLPSLESQRPGEARAEPPVFEEPTHPFAAAPQEGWEVVVGTSWLSKIGVVVFVVGLALLLGYSMANVGALGRVAIGYALSLGMLGTGIAFERRETYRNYAYGLIGGGWAGVYFTTYAMHALPAARIVDSELVASFSLMLAAAGMIVHSLRYQSQTLTSLAYVSAYAPLAFSPLTTFSLIATVPLTASLLVVASRFVWSGVAVLGLASTYAIFILRTFVVSAAQDATTLHFVLWTYWLLFETADIAARRHQGTRTPAPLFVLNAAGFLGAMVLHTTSDERQWLVIGAAAAAYGASALLRAQLIDRTRRLAEPPAETAFSTAHGATAVAAALFAYAIELRFAGSRQTIAWLVETQLLVAAGVSLADRHIRRIGTAVAALTTLHVAAVLIADLPPTGLYSVVAPSTTALLVATVWYGNREWLRRRGLTLDALEHVYGWVALVLVLDVIAREVPAAYRGSTALGFAILLLEAGFRRAAEYRRQSYVAVAAATILAGAAFILNPLFPQANPSFDRDVRIALPVFIALAYGFAARLARRTGSSGPLAELGVAAAVSSVIGTTFVLVFEWHVAPPASLGAVWTGTAAVLTAFGAWRGGAVFRWQGYIVAAIATLLPLAELALNRVDSPAEYAATLSAIAFLYAVGYVGRTTAETSSRMEHLAAGYVAFLGSALQALFVWRVVPADLVAPVWAGSAAALVTMGALRARPWQRAQAYGLILVATVRAAAVLGGFESPTAREALASAAVVALAYLTGYLGRAIRRPPAASDTETAVAGALSFVASLHLAVLTYQFLPPARVAAAWVTIALALMALGVRRARAGQRWQAYGLFAAGTTWMLEELAGAGSRDLVAMLWMVFAILAMYTTAMIVRPSPHSTASERTLAAEEAARIGLLIGATLVLSGLLVDEVGTRMATLAWALQGAALLVVGFVARERVLRLSGLALLFVCILKLFAYDLRQLEALARILSFVVLGLVLLAVSWAYTRYREQIRKLL